MISLLALGNIPVCEDVKTSYREQSCCGNDEKLFTDASSAFPSCSSGKYVFGVDLFRVPAPFASLLERYPDMSLPFKPQVEIETGRILPTNGMQCPGSQGLFMYASDVAYQGFALENTNSSGAIACHPSYPVIVNALEYIHASEVVLGYDFHTESTVVYPGTLAEANVTRPGTYSAGVAFADPSCL